jgi:hypothetical protein
MHMRYGDETSSFETLLRMSTAEADPNKINPWRRGTAATQGRYTFVPNRSKPGLWTVRVEQGGHSDFINISLP